VWTDLYHILQEGSSGEREDQFRVSLRLVEGCGSNGQRELYLPQNFAFAGSCTFSEYFLSSLTLVYMVNVMMMIADDNRARDLSASAAA